MKVKLFSFQGERGKEDCYVGWGKSPKTPINPPIPI
jgi:hypothetical protein